MFAQMSLCLQSSTIMNEWKGSYDAILKIIICVFV